jgi:NADH:ubiquinone oxidoreductase subunit B-like Fe-S oxidoreductase
LFSFNCLRHSGTEAGWRFNSKTMNDSLRALANNVVPVDIYIPGCPPHPITILDGLLRLLGRIE